MAPISGQVDSWTDSLLVGLLYMGFTFLLIRSVLVHPVELMFNLGKQFPGRPRWFYLLLATTSALFFALASYAGYREALGFGWVRRFAYICLVAVGAKRFAVASHAVCFLELEDLYAWFREHRVGYSGALLREHGAVREQGNQVS